MKIVLIGFMGSGKTTVAGRIARKLKLRLIDMDEVALQSSNRKTINEIFSLDGERKFRQIEFKVAKDLSGEDNVVISTGGGVVINPRLMNILNKNSITVYLRASFDTMKQRVDQKKIKPPLFKDVSIAQKLFKIRAPLYERYADMIVETDEKQVDEVAAEMIDKLQRQYGG